MLLLSEPILGLLVATVLGMLIGLERAIAGKHAGMRTYALVALGSALFTSVGVLASVKLEMFSGVNPLQIAGSVVLGIGFIGAGLAALRSDNHVELTTATGLWVAAGVGMAAGFGLYQVAFASAILVILIFSLFARIEHRIRVNYGTHPEA